MSAVGIVSIAVGVAVVCGRIPLLVAPAATLRWFQRTIGTNGRVRVMSALVLALGATMLWAGVSEDSVLATILSVFGVGSVAIGTLVLLFPDVYLAIVKAMLPSDATASLIGWRMAGLAGVVAGGVLVYFGALAL